MPFATPACSRNTWRAESGSRPSEPKGPSVTQQGFLAACRHDSRAREVEQQPLELAPVPGGIVDDDEGTPVPHGRPNLGRSGLELELRERTLVEHLENGLKDVFGVFARACHEHGATPRLGGLGRIQEVPQQEGLSIAVISEHLNGALTKVAEHLSGLLVTAMKPQRSRAALVDRERSRNDGWSVDLDLIDHPTDRLGLIDELPNGYLSRDIAFDMNRRFAAHRHLVNGGACFDVLEPTLPPYPPAGALSRDQKTRCGGPTTLRSNRLIACDRWNTNFEPFATMRSDSSCSAAPTPSETTSRPTRSSWRREFSPTSCWTAPMRPSKERRWSPRAPTTSSG